MAENLTVSSVSKSVSDTSSTVSTQYTPHTEHLWKVCIVGDIGTGKTQFRNKLCNDTFTIQYKSTIGVDFGLKVVKVDDNNTVRLQLWDIAGQERFGNMLRVYCKETVGVFIVVDHTRQSTIDAVKKWKSIIDAVCPWDELYPSDISSVILLVGKIDLSVENGNEHTTEYYDNFCKENGIRCWFRLSSKTGEGVNEACNAMVDICMKANVPVIPEKPTNEEKKEVPKDIKWARSPSAFDQFMEMVEQIFTPKKVENKQVENKEINETKGINPEAYKFIMHALAIYTDNQDEKKIVKLWKRMLTVLHSNPNINVTENTNKQLFDIVTEMHNVLVNKDLDDSTKVESISNFILDYVKENKK